MKTSTKLLRQVHPNFFINGELSSQAFFPFPKDDGKLSVYDGDMITPQDAYNHYTKTLQNESIGVWGVTCLEVQQVGLCSTPDPLDNFPSHALIDFGTTSKNAYRKLAKRLKEYAIKRGQLT